MTINEHFESTIKMILGQPVYAGGYYSADGVVSILKDLQSKVVGNGVIGVLPGDTKSILTKEMIDDLVERIEERVSNSIESMDEDSLIDKDSIEMSISGREASIDNISVDLSEISSEATWGIGSEVQDWTEDYDIVVTKKL